MIKDEKEFEMIVFLIIWVAITLLGIVHFHVDRQSGRVTVFNYTVLVIGGFYGMAVICVFVSNVVEWIEEGRKLNPINHPPAVVMIPR